MAKIRIISDGHRHRVETESGEELTNVTSVTIGNILPGKPTTAALSIIGSPLNIIADRLERTPPPPPPPDIGGIVRAGPGLLSRFFGWIQGGWTK